MSICCFCFTEVQAQTFVFAELNGSPTMNTTGWNLTGNATIGDTPGDLDNFNNELILTTSVGTWQSGAVFWNTPIDLAICSKWTAEFEFRIWEGSGADGLAFCFLDVPPTGFVAGGGVGIPATANGLKVVLDPFDNCGGPNPELQIYAGVGYDECAAGMVKLDNSLGNLNFIRDNNYQQAQITYDAGVVELYINNTLYLTGNAPANFTGYMGFTSSTGGLNDAHSIRNVIIYTEQANADAGPDVAVCDGQSVQIGAPNNPQYSYNWISGNGLNSTSISDPTVSISNSGSVPIYDTLVVETTVTSNPACPNTDTVIVTIAPNITQTVSITQCGGSYQWNGSTYQSSGVYTEQFLSSFGCDSIVTLDLTILPVPTISVMDTTICEGDLVVLSANGAMSYSWNGNSVGGNTYTTAPNITTVYEVVGADVNGCTDTVYATVNVNPAPQIQVTALPDTICAGGDATLSASGANSFVWSGSTINGVTSPTVIVTPNQTETYNVTGTDGIGCSAMIPITVEVISPPVLSVSGFNSNLCEGDSLTVTANGANSYEWLGNGITSPNNNPQLLVPQQNTSYQLIGFIGGCSDTLNLAVAIELAPVLSMQLPDIFCAGESDTIIVSGAQSYLWSPAVIEVSTGVAVVSPGSSESYTVTGIGANGCSAEISGIVQVAPLPNAAFIASDVELDIFVSTDVFFSNQSENASTYAWEFGDGTASTLENPMHTFPNQSTGSYPVTLYAFNNLGCYDSTVVWIQVEEGVLYFVPNSFTPNSDELNQLFLASFIGGFDAYNFELRVYNRWGESVFVTKNVQEGWDGTYQGMEVPDGTYSWIIQYKIKNNDGKRILKGHVNVIR